MDAGFAILMAEISNAWVDRREVRKKAKKEKKEAAKRALAKSEGRSESEGEDGVSEAVHTARKSGEERLGDKKDLQGRENGKPDEEDVRGRKQ